MNEEIGYFAPPIAQRTWATRDVLLGAAALAMGMAACVLIAMSSPIESTMARYFAGDYVLASRMTFWLATIPAGVIGLGGMFMSVSLLARRVRTFGLAMLGAFTGAAAVYLTALTLSGSY